MLHNHDPLRIASEYFPIAQELYNQKLLNLLCKCHQMDAAYSFFTSGWRTFGDLFKAIGSLVSHYLPSIKTNVGCSFKRPIDEHSPIQNKATRLGNNSSHIIFKFSREPQIGLLQTVSKRPFAHPQTGSTKTTSNEVYSHAIVYTPVMELMTKTSQNGWQSSSSFGRTRNTNNLSLYKKYKSMKTVKQYNAQFCLQSTIKWTF